MRPIGRSGSPTPRCPTCSSFPPPEISGESAALARERSNRLVDREAGRLSSYGSRNVNAFNHYNVLTDPHNRHRANAANEEENVVAGSPADAERAHARRAERADLYL